MERRLIELYLMLSMSASQLIVRKDDFEGVRSLVEFIDDVHYSQFQSEPSEKVRNVVRTLDELKHDYRTSSRQNDVVRIKSLVILEPIDEFHFAQANDNVSIDLPANLAARPIRVSWRFDPLRETCLVNETTCARTVARTDEIVRARGSSSTKTTRRGHLHHGDQLENRQNLVTRARQLNMLADNTRAFISC